MPQIGFRPFMPCTMVKDRHGVKPLPFAAARLRPQNGKGDNAIGRIGDIGDAPLLPRSAESWCRRARSLFKLWGLTQP